MNLSLRAAALLYISAETSGAALWQNIYKSSLEFFALLRQSRVVFAESACMEFSHIDIGRAKSLSTCVSGQIHKVRQKVREK
jgi:hypothetical protein